MSANFKALGIRDELVALLKENGVTIATPIQDKSIPPLLEGLDVIAQAQTGTGKTLAFALPIMERIKPEIPAVQALIITPTRELALQITTEVKKLAAVMQVNVLAAYGGQDVESQVKKLKGAIHIVIGTPGRLLDHLRRGTVQFSGLSMLVLDEADQMLNMGFLKDVEEIISQSPYKRQTMLFSATMPPAIRTLAATFMRKPMEIQVQSKEKHITLDEIKQIVIETGDREKPDALCLMIDKYVPYLAIIFCRTKKRATVLNAQLVERGYSSDELHGDLTQAKREQVMKKFRNAKLQLLVATDIAARGLDIEGITHIFNYDIPHDVESYIHRIGRTGRAGQSGIAFTLVTPTDKQYLQLIEDGIHKRLERTTAEGVPILYKPAKRGNFPKENRDFSQKNRRPVGQEHGPSGAGKSFAGQQERGAAGAGRGALRSGSASGYSGDRTPYGKERSSSGQDRRKGSYSQDRSDSAAEHRTSSNNQDHDTGGQARRTSSFGQERGALGQGRGRQGASPSAFNKESASGGRFKRESRRTDSSGFAARPKRDGSSGSSRRSAGSNAGAGTRGGAGSGADAAGTGAGAGTREGFGFSASRPQRANSVRTGVDTGSTGRRISSSNVRPKRDGSFKQAGGAGNSRSAAANPKRDGSYTSKRSAAGSTGTGNADGARRQPTGTGNASGARRKPTSPRKR